MNRRHIKKKCVARGNCYPTEHAAIEAREQQDNGAPKFSTEQTARHLLADASPEYKCLQCGWAGLYTGIKYDITCNSIRCSESVCPECGASWPVPFDDVIETI